MLRIETDYGTVTLTADEVNHYLPFYSEYTPASVLEALAVTKARFGHLDAMTVNARVLDKEYGGEGMGVHSG